MKKSILFIAAGALALSACTSSEVIEEGVQSNAIRFQNMVSKESRALTSTDLKNFYVYAYYTLPNKEAEAVGVFNGEVVSRTDLTKNEWSYDNTRYWVPKAKYYFYAYSCDNNTLTSNDNGDPSLDVEGNTVASRVLTISNYRCDVRHQDDLIYASNEGTEGKEPADEGASEPNNKPVALAFKHILSKVYVTFENEFPEGYSIIISNVKFKNIVNFADYNPNSGWSNFKRENISTNVLPYFDLGVDGSNVAVGETKVKTIAGYTIPCQYNNQNVTIEFEIEVTSEVVNDEVTSTTTVLKRVLSGSWKPNWIAGTSYTYNVKINGTAANLEPIVFETAQNIDDWSDPGEGNQIPDISFSAN